MHGKVYGQQTQGRQLRSLSKDTKVKYKPKYFGRITIGVPGSLPWTVSLIQRDTKNFLSSLSSKSHASSISLSTMSSTPLLFFQHLVPLLSLDTLEPGVNCRQWLSNISSCPSASDTGRTVVELVLYADAPSCHHLGHQDWSSPVLAGSYCAPRAAHSVKWQLRNCIQGGAGVDKIEMGGTLAVTGWETWFSYICPWKGY